MRCSLCTISNTSRSVLSDIKRKVQPSVLCLIKHDNSVLSSLNYDYKRILIRMNNYIIIPIRMNNYIKNTNEDEFYQI
jgi:hypothetical protein